MKTLFALAAAMVVGTALAQQPQYGCDSPESKQMDFWLGTWDLSYKAPNGQPVKSRNRISKVLDGCAILEEFDGGAGTKLAGRSFSVYDKATQRWRQTWVDNTAAYLDLEGATVDGNMAFVRTVERNGRKSHQRMVWRDVKPDSFTWIWQASPDGQTWTTQWEIAYTRAK